MDDSLRVASGAITVTACLKVVAQVPVVIDFAVEDDPNAFVLIADGLVSGLDVDNAKAAHCQCDILLDKKAVIVGPAVDDLLVHRSQSITTHALVRLGMENAADSAHDYTPIPLRSSPGTFRMVSAHACWSGCCRTTFSGSEQKISVFIAALNTSA